MEGRPISPLKPGEGGRGISPLKMERGAIAPLKPPPPPHPAPPARAHVRRWWVVPFGSALRRFRASEASVPAVYCAGFRVECTALCGALAGGTALQHLLASGARTSRAESSR